MNKQEGDILKFLYREKYTNQRSIAARLGYSLGLANKLLGKLMKEGYLDSQFALTEKAFSVFRAKAPRNAIILAAGYGTRMIPLNMETPKAFLKLRGEYLIERQIRQLNQAGVFDIYIVVGFMKEKFEYLSDKYGVKLVYNRHYAGRNNLFSLKLLKDYISNSYIVPSDVWCRINPFSQCELYSWYMVSETLDEESEVRVNRNAELVRVKENETGNKMIGISYILEEEAERLREKISDFASKSEYHNAFWEEALYRKDRMTVEANVVAASDVIEINTYEQLREIEHDSNQLVVESIRIAAEALAADRGEIKNIKALKKGMTNRSFLFNCKKKKYILRIPGEGTDNLINRFQEAEVYQTIKDKGICDDIVYINPKNGFKLSAYIENARVCDPFSKTDVDKCMKKLREFHDMRLRVGHRFDIYAQIEFYESLWGGQASVFSDYESTKEKVLSLKAYIEKHKKTDSLTHIDAVPDNFLFALEGEEELVRLIDWEYAGMQDSDVDIAMFSIYAGYDKAQVDALIDSYYLEGCAQQVRIKIYCYVALCGLLWSNWCEYKRFLGIEFGEYSLSQYRYAKQYYKIAVQAMKDLGENQDA